MHLYYAFFISLFRPAVKRGFCFLLGFTTNRGYSGPIQNKDFVRPGAQISKSVQNRDSGFPGVQGA